MKMIAVNQRTWASDVFLPYYWRGDNVWKWLLLSNKRHQAILIILINHYVKTFRSTNFLSNI